MAKLSLFLIALFVISTVNLSWSPKMLQVMGTRDLALDLAAMEKNLFPVKRGLGTCLRACSSNKDCDDCWACCTCMPPVYSGTGYFCDNRNANGEGFFTNILKAKMRAQQKIIATVA